jgi:hypothetical protein
LNRLNLEIHLYQEDPLFLEVQVVQYLLELQVIQLNLEDLEFPQDPSVLPNQYLLWPLADLLSLEVLLVQLYLVDLEVHLVHKDQ